MRIAELEAWLGKKPKNQGKEVVKPGLKSRALPKEWEILFSLKCRSLSLLTFNEDFENYLSCMVSLWNVPTVWRQQILEQLYTKMNLGVGRPLHPKMHTDISQLSFCRFQNSDSHVSHFSHVWPPACLSYIRINLRATTSKLLTSRNICSSYPHDNSFIHSFYNPFVHSIIYNEIICAICLIALQWKDIGKNLLQKRGTRWKAQNGHLFCEHKILEISGKVKAEGRQEKEVSKVKIQNSRSNWKVFVSCEIFWKHFPLIETVKLLISRAYLKFPSLEFLISIKLFSEQKDSGKIHDVKSAIVSQRYLNILQFPVIASL